MNLVAEKVNDFLADERGATAVEYGIFVALIAAVIVGLVSDIGAKLKTAFNTVSTALGTL